MLKFIFLLTLSTYLGATMNFDRYNSSLMMRVTKDGTAFICSAVAVSRKILVTAAHCLDGADKIEVFKSHKIKKINFYRKISHFTIHPKYSKKKSNYMYDIGKLILKKDLPRSIIIPKLSSPYLDSKPLVRVGFGMRNGKNSRTVLSQLTAYTGDDKHIRIQDMHSYSGDSGGPIYKENNGILSVVGIHSTKEGNQSLNPNIYFFKDWIFSNQ